MNTVKQALLNHSDYFLASLNTFGLTTKVLRVAALYLRLKGDDDQRTPPTVHNSDKKYHLLEYEYIYHNDVEAPWLFDPIAFNASFITTSTVDRWTQGKPKTARLAELSESPYKALLVGDREKKSGVKQSALLLHLLRIIQQYIHHRGKTFGGG